MLPERHGLDVILGSTSEVALGLGKAKPETVELPVSHVVMPG
ncbi:MAG: hypothetical protein ACI8QS_002257 [Planctomycetota bacterium]|jgi:hypothetical protein